MLKNKNDLSPREKRFCSFYVSSGDFREAAAMAGYNEPVKNGSALLARTDINAEIERIYQARSDNYSRQARAGYERLAFGNVTDAVRLMFLQQPDENQLRELDLFNVAEIKRPKDGALEIKFFDRIKALEKLEGMKQEERSRVSDFYSALAGSVCGEQPDQDGGDLSEI